MRLVVCFITSQFKYKYSTGTNIRMYFLMIWGLFDRPWGYISTNLQKWRFQDAGRQNMARAGIKQPVDTWEVGVHLGQSKCLQNPQQCHSCPKRQNPNRGFNTVQTKGSRTVEISPELGRVEVCYRTIFRSFELMQSRLPLFRPTTLPIHTGMPRCSLRNPTTLASKFSIKGKVSTFYSTQMSIPGNHKWHNS